jgi:HD superfamily phosphohydrolase
MDYLVRDSYYTGARYGQIDADWLLANLVAYPVGREVTLALDSRAIYAFDDFMIARHHMFLMVYFHHKSVVYEEMLKRYVLSPECTFSLSADLDAYLVEDDVALEYHLRTADSEWARRIVEGRPYRRVLERHGTPVEVDLGHEKARLEAAGVDVVSAGSTGQLSRYNVIGQKREKAPAILVLERLPGQPVETVKTLAEASQVFERYAEARRIARLYVAPEAVDRAREVLGLPVAED